MVFLWIFFGVGGRMGAIFQIKRFFDLKKLLFILPLIFCFSLSFARVAMVCDYDDQGNRGDCTCYENDETVPCKCEGSPSPVSGRSCKLYSCIQYAGSGCYKDHRSACTSNGFINAVFISEGGEIVVRCVNDVGKYYGIVTSKKLFFCNNENPFNDCGNDNGDGGNDDDNNSSPSQADQKKVCSNGECKCYNLTTGYEEACLGSPSSGGDSGSGSGSDTGSGSDNGSGSVNTGTGSGSGSGDSGNGQGAGSQGSPSAGNGTNSGAGGDNSGTGTGSNNGNNSGGGTHTGISGNTHGGGGTSLGGGSDNGSDNGKDDGKEDGSEDGDDYCLKNPKSVVCNGEPKQGDFDDIVIPTKEVKDSWVKDMFLPDNGICPAPLKANFLGKTISISYEPLCRLLNQVRFAILLLFAYISARLGLGGKL